jgi:NhaP-type Na+/H+ or K+/H+ antiporter
MTTDDFLIGLGLAIVLAVGTRLLAERLRLPAIVLLLPVGFAAGAITSDVDPNNLFAGAFQPMVSLGVGIILFEAGIRLRLRDLTELRSVVFRLISVGSAVTLVGVTAAAKAIFGLDLGVAAMLGAILVVSGPTVVLPLLDFVRPSEEVRATLKWEGVLIDPIGALLGVLVFSLVNAGAHGGASFHPGEFLSSLLVGAAVGVAGAGLMSVVLRRLQRETPRNLAPAALMFVIAAVVVADLVRQDSGFVAATVMGAALANQERVDVARILEFHGTLVSLLIGILFILISASVAPSQVREVLPEGLVLIAAMIVVIRPLAVLLSTARSTLDRSQRAFIAWMAPRGIVAAATASAFGIELSQAGVADAAKILPISFVAIFGTVLVYGLTAAPVGRLLGVAGRGEPIVLIVGGQDWARRLALALGEFGMHALLLTGDRGEREAAAADGIDVLAADLSEVDPEEELEGVEAALLLTRSDDFNALAASQLRKELGRDRVFRLVPGGGEIDLLPAYAEGELLFDPALTYRELERRFASGARLAATEPDAIAVSGVPLFRADDAGNLIIVTAGSPGRASSGERSLVLVEA